MWGPLPRVGRTSHTAGAHANCSLFWARDHLGGSVWRDVRQRALPQNVGGARGRSESPTGGARRMSTPKNYRSFAEFQREEIARDHKLGWSIDDLMHDA